MRKFLAILLLLSSAAYAADNTVTLTPGSGVTMRTQDVGSGVQSPYNILGNTSGTSIYGTAGTSNAAVLSVQGIASGTALPVSLTSTTVTGTVAVTESGTWNITNISGTISLPTGAATSALQTTINTTLGSPFQAGGSIGNTTFAATQGTAANLNATVVGTGTFATQAAQSGTWNITNVSGTVSLPTGASTSAKQPALGTAGSASTDVITIQGIASMTKLLVTPDLPTGASTAANQSSIIGTKNAGTAATNSELVGGVYNSTPLTLTDTQQASIQVDANGYLKVNVAAGGASGGTSSSFAASFPATGTAVGMSQGGNMVALTGTSNNLNVQCANCSGSGVSTADEATFTAGTSLFAGVGGFFQTTATSNALTNGQQGMWQMTAQRAGFVNLRAVGGTEIGTSAAEVFVGGRGTAGSAAGGVLTIQGVASMTKLLVTPDSVALPANQSVNVSQINAVTVLMGNGATGTGSQRVTIANDNTLPTGWASSVAQGSTTSGQTGPLAQGAVTTAAPTYTTAQTSPLSLTTAGDLRTVFSNTTLAVTNAGTFAVQIAANSAVNVAQINGVTPLMGNGVTGTGSQRVTIASDNTAFSVNATLGTETTKVIGTVRTVGNVGGVLDAIGQNVAAPANWLQAGCQFNTTPTTITSTNGSPLQCDNGGKLLVNTGTVTVTATNLSANVAQINGVTPLMGNGTSGTGAQRVAIASDNSAVSGLGIVATGAAPPANAVYNGALTSGATNGLVQGLIQCDSTAIYDASTSGSTQVVALTSGRTIYVCGYAFSVGGTATNVKLVYGTGTNCATGANNMTPAYQIAANGGIVDRAAFSQGLKTASANALCVNASAANAVQAIVYYAVL